MSYSKIKFALGGLFVAVAMFVIGNTVDVNVNNSLASPETACHFEIGEDMALDEDISCLEPNIDPDDGTVIPVFQFTSDNVTLDCQGRKITGPELFTNDATFVEQFDASVGALVDKSNITIKNCIFEGFRDAVHVNSGSANVTLDGVGVFKNTTGVSVIQNSNVTLQNSSLRANKVAVHVSGSIVTSTGNAVHNNASYGFYTESITTGDTEPIETHSNVELNESYICRNGVPSDNYSGGFDVLNSNPEVQVITGSNNTCDLNAPLSCNVTIAEPDPANPICNTTTSCDDPPPVHIQHNAAGCGQQFVGINQPPAIEVPDTIAVGQEFNASITTSNYGESTWKAPKYFLASDLGFFSGPTELALQQQVPPVDPTNHLSTPTTFTGTFRAPDTAGAYRFAFQMKQQGVGNFGQVCSTTITVGGQTASFTSTAGDGSVGYKVPATSFWTQLWSSTFGTDDSTSSTGALMYVGAQNRGGGSFWQYNRTFVPFDTSALPDDAVINRARVKLYVDSKVHDREESLFDWVAIEQATQPNVTALTIEDYDQIATIPNPVEGSQRIDFEDVEAGFVTFELNQPAINWISKNSHTKLGIRIGEDILHPQVEQSTFPGSGSNDNLILFRTVEHTEVSTRPQLIINYTSTTIPTSPTPTPTWTPSLTPLPGFEIISGRLTLPSGAGVPSHQMFTCPDPASPTTPVITGTDGYFSFYVRTGQTFCVRADQLGSAPIGFYGPRATNNLINNTYTSYEWQVAGRACVNNDPNPIPECIGGERATNDRDDDTGYDFQYLALTTTTPSVTGTPTPTSTSTPTATPGSNGFLRGVIVNDTNGNRQYDNGEFYISNDTSCNTTSQIVDGFRINYAGPTSGSGIVDQCNTNGLGLAHFSRTLPSGSYTLNLTMPPGWVNITQGSSVLVAAGASSLKYFYVQPTSIPTATPTPSYTPEVQGDYARCELIGGQKVAITSGLVGTNPTTGYGQLAAGQPFTAKVKFFNNGTTTWTTNPPSNYVVGLADAYLAPNISDWGSNRVYFPANTSIEPGESIEFTITRNAPAVRPPSQAGLEYDLSLILLNELPNQTGYWFDFGTSCNRLFDVVAGGSPISDSGSSFAKYTLAAIFNGTPTGWTSAIVALLATILAYFLVTRYGIPLARAGALVVALAVLPMFGFLAFSLLTSAASTYTPDEMTYLTGDEICPLTYADQIDEMSRLIDELPDPTLAELAAETSVLDNQDFGISENTPYETEADLKAILGILKTNYGKDWNLSMYKYIPNTIEGIYGIRAVAMFQQYADTLSQGKVPVEGGEIGFILSEVGFGDDTLIDRSISGIAPQDPTITEEDALARLALNTTFLDTTSELLYVDGSLVYKIITSPKDGADEVDGFDELGDEFVEQVNQTIYVDALTGGEIYRYTNDY